MYLLTWLLTMLIALLATSTIVVALPQSAADELSAAAAPQPILVGEWNRMGEMFASCEPDIDRREH
jgi:hypothetical protein